jgi:hypothetical protein
MIDDDQLPVNSPTSKSTCLNLLYHVFIISLTIVLEKEPCVIELQDFSHNCPREGALPDWIAPAILQKLY